MRLVLILTILFCCHPALAHYNEMRDDEGRLRPAYQVLGESLEALSPSKKRQFKRKSRQAFANDNSLSPIPRILDPKEFDFLKRGVEQRGRALMAFLKDHYSGRKSYLSAGIVPEGVVRGALLRAGELRFDGLVDPEKISMFYGPDLVRAEKDGKKSWYVLEDNTGFVGGFGDLILAQKLIRDLHPDLDGKLRMNNPLDFYKDLALEFHRRAAAKGGIAVMFRDLEASDNEGDRVEQIFSALGIPTVRPQDSDRVVVKDKIVFLKSLDNKGRTLLRRVGMLLIHDELSWIDRTHPATADQYVFDLANMFLEPGEAKVGLQNEVREILKSAAKGRVPSVRKLKRILIDSGYMARSRSLIPGLVESALNGQVDLITTPGTNFVSDKEVYLYVDKMIPFYLGESPILKQPKSQTLSFENLNAVFSNLDESVIKRFDGRGGKVVWVGPKLKEKEIRNLRRLVDKSPETYKAQELLQISRLDKNIVDARLFSYINPERSIIADVPWGRGAPLSGDGKVNLSGTGHEVTVLVGRRRSAADCETLLK